MSDPLSPRPDAPRPRSYRDASEFDDFDRTRDEINLDQTRRVVEIDMEVHSVQTPRTTETGIEIRGRLRRPSHEVFGGWRDAFARMKLLPFLMPDQASTLPGAVLLRLVDAPPGPKPGKPVLNLVLFVLTIFTTFFVGSLYSPDVRISGLADFLNPAVLVRGWPFALTLLAILGVHELGHFFAARHHRIPVSLPYFLPVPFAFGTLGAFIRLRGPINDRRQLFDVGVAGPLAGLAVALPLLFVGLQASEMTTISGQVMLEGNSLLYWGAKYLVFNEWLPDFATGLDVHVGPMAMAAWIGLLATGLNLLPVGNLDGGHVVFSLFGLHARHFFRGTLLLLAVLGIAGFAPLQAYLPALEHIGYTGWLVWLWLIILVMGPSHAITLDMVTELDGRRRWLGYAVLLVFVLTFVPVPLRTFVF